MRDTAAVIIGRNEGERLRRCLTSLEQNDLPMVYVDSGSTDGSVAMAQAMGVEVVELDTSIPFSAARARNAGIERLVKRYPQAVFVQFIDGDCEVIDGWSRQARQELLEVPDLAAVCGRNHERYPEQSIYNRLCDIEWDTPVGDTDACGGIAMMRIAAYQQAGGFDPKVIAGEEPELCYRMRKYGWRIRRIDADMTWHDAAMSRFRQWWKRAVRSGHAYAQVAWMHRHEPERFWRRPTRSNWFWGLLLPLVVAALAWPTRGWSALLLIGYPVLMFRIYGHMRQRDLQPRHALAYAFFCTLSKFAQAWGQVRFHRNRFLRRRSEIIEYKQPAAVEQA